MISYQPKNNVEIRMKCLVIKAVEVEGEQSVLLVGFAYSCLVGFPDWKEAKMLDFK